MPCIHPLQRELIVKSCVGTDRVGEHGLYVITHIFNISMASIEVPTALVAADQFGYSAVPSP
jgi:hypothetical protein